ncbi:MAG: DMT family transporter [Bacillota bacterium]
MNSKKGIGILCAVLGGISWGFSACFGQYLFENVPVDTNWVISLRLVFAGLIFVVISIATQGKKTFAIFKNFQDMRRLLVFGILGMFGSQYTFYLAIQHANAGTATVLQSLATVMILIYVSITHRKMPKIKQTVAILLALFGVVLLSTGGDFTTLQMSQIALVAGLLSAVGAACYNMLSGGIIRKYGVYSVAGFGMLISGLIFLPFARPWETAVTLSPQLFIGMFGVVVIGTAVAFGFFLKGVSIVGPLMGSLIGTLEPVSAVVISALLLGSNFTTVDFIAFAMILWSVFWLCLQERSFRN